MVETQLCKLRGTSDIYTAVLFERSEFLIDASQKKIRPSARVPVCTRVRLILVLVCGIMYHIRMYLVSARYQPATKIRICLLYTSDAADE